MNAELLRVRRAADRARLAADKAAKARDELHLAIRQAAKTNSYHEVGLVAGYSKQRIHQISEGENNQ